MLACRHGAKTRAEGRASAFQKPDRTRSLGSPLKVFRGGRFMKRRVLVVDIGGTRVKLLMSQRNRREFASGPGMRPEQLIRELKEAMRGWKLDWAPIVFPGPGA